MLAGLAITLCRHLSFPTLEHDLSCQRSGYAAYGEAPFPDPLSVMSASCNYSRPRSLSSCLGYIYLDNSTHFPSLVKNNHQTSGVHRRPWPSSAWAYAASGQASPGRDPESSGARASRFLLRNRWRPSARSRRPGGWAASRPTRMCGRRVSKYESQDLVFFAAPNARAPEELRANPCQSGQPFQSMLQLGQRFSEPQLRGGPSHRLHSGPDSSAVDLRLRRGELLTGCARP